MVLARANRVLRPGDFRSAVRSGRRVGSANTVVYVLRRGELEPTRFGFIVGKTVGTAVRRNRVRRKLRAIGRGVLESRPAGVDIVVRALPVSAEASWDTLSVEVVAAIDRSGS